MNYMGIADTAATGNYVTTDCPVTDMQPTTNGIDVTLPNGVNITSSHTALLQLPHELPIGACKADIFPGLKSGSLVSIGQLCDHGCTATFTATQVQIFHQERLILTGHRSIETNNLWMLQLDGMLAQRDQQGSTRNQVPMITKTIEPTIGTANSMVVNNTIADRIAFYHAAAFSPVISTWCEAIDNGHFTTWPELTSTHVCKYLPNGSGPMVKGHLHQQHSNLRSTKKFSSTKEVQNAAANQEVQQDPAGVHGSPAGLQHGSPGGAAPRVQTEVHQDQAGASPSENPGNEPSNEDFAPVPMDVHANSPQEATVVFVEIEQVTGKTYSDQTGKFLAPSATGSNYVMIFYEYDSNSIHAEPIKNRTAGELKRAYSTFVKLLTSRGLHPKLQILDNEASKLLVDYISGQGIDYQLAPPHVHRRNAAERAISTYKDHFIAGLCSTDKNYPLDLWDKLIPQSVITLNLLRRSRINPQLSAYAQVFGAFDFNKTPLAPPGTRVLVHEKPIVRQSWDPRAIDAWYIGPAMKHYRCYQQRWRG
jgi:hypothetical protein